MAFCALLVLLGIAVIAGWTLGIEAMKSVVPGLSTMKLNTAIAFVLVGLALAGAASARPTLQRLATLAGAATAVIGALTVFEYVAEIDLGIDEMLVRDTGILTGSGHPGRMSPLTASAWIALGTAIILLAGGRDRRPIIAAHFLAAAAGFTAFLAGAGYAFGAEAFWGIGFYTAMAVHTAIGLLVAVAAALMTRADEGWLSRFGQSPDARALLAELLPISFLLPTMLGFLLLFGSGLGAYNAAFGFALFVPVMTLALVGVALRVAQRARNGELALRGSEAALRESEERLSTALDVAQLGTFDWDLQSDMVALDARARSIFGLSEVAAVKGEELLSRVHPADLQRVLAELRASRDYMTRLELEYRIRLPDGAARTLLSFYDVVGAHQAQRIFGAVSDISERKRLEEDLRNLNETLEERVRERSAELERVHEQLRQSQKLEAMGQLTGGVAHDFNNLLSPIIGGLDLIQRRGNHDDRTRRLIDGALSSAERAKTLVQRLLAFARRQPLQPTAVDLGALLSGMSDLIASTSGPRIKLIVELQPGLPPAEADPNQLEMALLNLAVNARDAMPDGGTLTIKVDSRDHSEALDGKLPPGSYLCVSVADSGVGMDEETVARAIEPFFSTKGIGQGTGLGLSMVHGLAAQLGGELRLQSKLGLGTIVELWLPVSSQRSADLSVDSDRRSGLDSGTALLVDDEEHARAATAGMLTDLGYQVIEAASAEEALRALQGGANPDIVVTDHLMPGITGTDLARSLHDRRPSLPILIISGYAAVEDIAPDLPRLAKPFRQSDLALALSRLVDADQIGQLQKRG